MLKSLFSHKRIAYRNIQKLDKAEGWYKKSKSAKKIGVYSEDGLFMRACPEHADEVLLALQKELDQFREKSPEFMNPEEELPKP